jgi:beta-glucosidase
MSRQLAAEGIVLLKNDKNTLPLTDKNNLAVFGRVQNDYFYVGYGSGGDVKAPYRVSLVEGLINNGKIKINSELAEVYRAWCANNVPDEGSWGCWPLNFKEMPISDEMVSKAANKSDTALVAIGRAAGEDRDQKLIKGGYYLTDLEIEMLDKVTVAFGKVIILVNSGNIIDLSWIEKYGKKITSLLYVWQGGMESGNAVADVLSGDVSPSGKLSDSIAKTYSDYPTCVNFGHIKFNNYSEDIYVGYRYFETFAKEKTLFPFGFGLSYTQFKTDCNFSYSDEKAVFDITVQNTGKKHSGKEVVQIYVKAPQGKLGKAERSLIGFCKTAELKPSENQTLKIEVPISDFMSYDDSGITGNKSCNVAEAGEYGLFIGSDVRSSKEVGKFVLDKPVIKEMQEICALKKENAFKIIKPVIKDGKAEIGFSDAAIRTTSLRQRILDNMPAAVAQTGDKGIKLIDVKNGKASLDDLWHSFLPKSLKYFAEVI